jgi:DNA-binding transcriptional LysR family regulator
MSRISIPQLEAFYWTAELGSVLKAAERLNIAQPTLSLRLRQLEEAVPSALLERAGRGVRLTPDGHRFLRHAKLVLAAHRELQASVAVAEMSGTVRVGLAEGFAVACLPKIIAEMREAYPLLAPEWTISTSSGLEQNLAEGRLDLAVLVDPIGQRDVRFHFLGAQSNHWAAPVATELPNPATTQALARQTIITTPPPTSMYRQTMSWFADERTQPAGLCFCSSLNASLQLVAAGIGIGLFPTRMIQAYPGAAKLRAIQSDQPLADGRVYIADRADSDPSRTASMARLFEHVTSSMGYFSALRD